MNGLSQKGSILIITLLLMLMLTVMAVSQISFNSTQTHIATNTGDQQIAFQTAEGALNEATNNLLAGNYSTTGFLSNANGLYTFDPTSPPLWTTVNWTNANAVIMSFKGKSNSQASYLIEQLPSVIRPGQSMNAPAQVYRITAHSSGASGNTTVILQSTVQIQ